MIKLNCLTGLHNMNPRQRRKIKSEQISRVTCLRLDFPLNPKVHFNWKSLNDIPPQRDCRLRNVNSFIFCLSHFFFRRRRRREGFCYSLTRGEKK